MLETDNIYFFRPSRPCAPRPVLVVVLHSVSTITGEEPRAAGPAVNLECSRALRSDGHDPPALAGEQEQERDDGRADEGGDAIAPRGFR